MPTLSGLGSLLLGLLWIGTSMGCTDTRSNGHLPTSALEIESWLQTSRKIRYAFDVNTKWEGWVLHSPKPERIAIAVFTSKSNTLPNSEQWHDCIRPAANIPSLWLSGTVETITLTRRYAVKLDGSLPIVQVEC